jgi:two-component system, cell cycle sensor histidine kinase and response regulator CckA
VKHLLADLLDIPRLQSALDSLYISSGIPSAILDTEGIIHTASGWQDVCTKFHRVHPEARKRCTESDLYINRHLHEANPSITYRCPHGLVETATPIIIESEHLGNVFTGQMFLEEPDLDSFRARARAYGFDEGTYIDAVKKVPIISEKVSQENLAFIAHITGMLAEMGLKRTSEGEAERRLRESEERYRSLFGKASDGVIIMSPDGKLIEVNESFARMHGYSTGELLQMNIRDLDTPKSAQLIPERMRQLLTGEILAFEVEHHHKDGHVFPLEVSANLIPIGGESYIQCFHRDITERKRADEAIRSDSERLLLATRAGGVGIWELDTVNNNLIWDDQMFRLYGITSYKFGGSYEAWRAGVHPEDLPQGEAELQMALRGEKEFDTEFRVVWPDGTIHHIRALAQVHRDASGKPTNVIGTNYDVTEHKRVEEALRRSKDLLGNVLNTLPVGVWILDANGKILEGNPACLKIWGGAKYVGPELYGEYKGWWLSTGKLIAPEEWAGARAVRNGDTSLDEEIEIEGFDGTRKIILNSAVPLRNDRGEITGAIILNNDITDRKRSEEEKQKLERQLQQAQKLESLGVLAGGIAHDFNNLLMVVLGHSELALKEISPMSPARGSLTEIAIAARRAADLCRQMLAYAGKASFAVERVGLRELVEEMAQLLQTAISKKAILDLNLERGLPPIEADPSQIRQVVLNLILNASEAIGDRSGVITVSVAATRCGEEYLRKTELHDALAPGLYVHLEVTDTGSGMDAGTRSRIFEPFFSTKFTGRGLGLAAVLGIVRAHKGGLKLYSEPGKGTTFKILFPALTEGEDATLTSESSLRSDWRGKGTILLVDDEESLIALEARMLGQLGFTVLRAADGLQAVELYRERGKEIDLVLMDLTMPHMDGIEAFGELRRLNPDVRVVLASGYSHEDMAARFAGKGLAGVLQKPYTLSKMRESLTGLLPKQQGGEG